MKLEGYQIIEEALRYTLIMLGILAATLLIFSPVYFSLQDRRIIKEEMKNAFGGREPLSEQAFHERYFKSRGVPFEVAAKVRRILADELNADMLRLSREDDFTGNLAFFFEGDGLDSVEIIMRLEEDSSITISDDEAARMRTVEEIVLMTWAKVARKTA